ncbi:MltA domain-containing protein [Maridesulfovibrio sp.]|uniref:murein transglycosylase A n=1 Tax=Maridesulfovibrio sp. TaxID=2795000 RepID=UPI002A189D19|nr:MltA domain-containing protein [Maridesulfovibrio sp.]
MFFAENTLKKLLYLIVVVAFSLAGCSTRTVPTALPGKGYVKIDRAQVQGLVNRLYTQSGPSFSWMSLKSGVEQNLKYLSRRNGNSVAARYGAMTITWEMLRRTNEEFLQILPHLDDSPELLEDKFVWYELVPRTLLTGYYEPYLEASLTPDPDYPYPLYSLPSDLKKMDLGKFHHRWKGQTLLYRIEDGEPVPYYDREKIDFDGALQGQGLEVAWVKDRVDIFMLQVQGSGRLVLPDGSVKHVLYAGKNGLKYVSLGKELIQRGLLPKEGMSMQKIRTFFKENPQLVEKLLVTNPSYVFFRLDDEGPFGSMGSPLTPMASIATDTKVIPHGSLGLLTVRLPVQGQDTKEASARIVMAQDRGGAIKGTRVDLFCGSGPDAEFLAGHLNSWGHVYFPVSREYLEETGKM